MRKQLFLVTTLLLVVSKALFAQEANLEDLEEQAFKQAAALVEPSIVRIETVGGLDRVGKVLVGDGPTTGVIVSKDGYIISSSFNFVSKPTSILVRMPDGRPKAAKIVATDHSKMLTLLKIDADDLTPPEIAEKDSVKVGQWSLAMGRTYDSPLPSVSVGIVSAKDRIWGRAIQTDAKVSPVNYGGPLVNVQGEVMGILVPLSTRGQGEIAGVEWYDGGIGFAIPMEDIDRVLDRLKDGEDLKPGLLGISFKAGGGKLGGDPVIDRVRVNSPADKAGLQVGDEILKVDDREIIRQADVKHALGNKYAGEEITLTAKRDDKTYTKTIELVDELTPYESGFLGILPFRELDGEQKQAGVGVRFVYSDSPAAKAGLKTRDRIIKFNGEEIANAAQLTDEVSRVMPGEKATLQYVREGGENSAEVELASIPNTVVEELRSSAIPAGEKPDNPDEAPKTGRFDAQVPDSDMNYWAYVPEDYNPAFPYGLMVWIHPGGDTMEQEILGTWKQIAQQRGLILVGPKAQKISGWTPNEAEVVKALVEEVKETYSISESRTFLHTFSNGGRLAYPLLFKHRDMFQGLASVTSPLQGKPGENDPDFRQQFHLVVGENAALKPRVDASIKALEKLKFPISTRTVPGLKDDYPAQEVIEEIARWADSLDRI